MEIVSESPCIVVDGAHNPHAAQALASTLVDVRYQHLILLLGVSRDKDVAAIAKWLVPKATYVFATQTQQPRALPARELHNAIQRIFPHTNIECMSSCANALTQAIRLCGGDDLILATGSLFVAGEVRCRMLPCKSDPVWISDPV